MQWLLKREQECDLSYSKGFLGIMIEENELYDAKIMISGKKII